MDPEDLRYLHTLAFYDLLIHLYLLCAGHPAQTGRAGALPAAHEADQKNMLVQFHLFLLFLHYDFPPSRRTLSMSIPKIGCRCNLLPPLI